MLRSSMYLLKPIKFLRHRLFASSISTMKMKKSFCTNNGNENTDITAEKSSIPSFRHHYCKEVESIVNKQILAELNASMVYLSMCCHYGRTDVALPGCQAFFKKMYYEEQEHAMDFINYQLMRGAHVKLYPITVPENVDWHDITVALGVALELEKTVKEKLHYLACVAERFEDYQLVDVVQGKYMKEQNESICELGRLLIRGKRMIDDGEIGRHLFDHVLFEYVASKFSKDASRRYI